MSLMRISNIFFKSIDFDDTSYSLSSQPEFSVPKDLSKSIARVGLLHPPILKETSHGMYIIACGRKRLLCAKENLNLDRCGCHIIPLDVDLIETWTIIINEMQLGTPLTAVEKAVFFTKTAPIIDIEKAAKLFLPLMGLKPQVYQIKKLIKLAELEEPIRSAITSGSLDQKAAYELIPLSFRDRFALFDIINNFHLSVGNQRKIIAICKELEKRNRKAILAILSDITINEIINSSANVPQKAASIMKHLTEQLSPQLTTAEKDFKTFIRTLQLPNNATLSHSPAFENDSITLQYNFTSKNQFIEFWDKLNMS